MKTCIMKPEIVYIS